MTNCTNMLHRLLSWRTRLFLRLTDLFAETYGSGGGSPASGDGDATGVDCSVLFSAFASFGLVARSFVDDDDVGKPTL